MEQTTVSLHLDHSQQGQYVTIPFTVPERTASLTVSYRYDRVRQDQSGPWTSVHTSSIVDLALLDPSGELAGASGANRQRIEIGPVSATPGYRPGCPVPGVWQIVAGAYVIAPEGVTVTYDISWTLQERRTLRGDLHTHTLASDGILTLDELVRHGRRHGLDFLAVTDHNTVQAGLAAFQPEGLTVICGLEWTHYMGHANFLGVTRPFSGSFHANTDTEVQAIFNQARARGAVIVINHPQDPDYGFHFDLADLPYDVLEVWNGPMRDSNLEAVACWHQLLQSGLKVPACCGSDYHRDSLFQTLGSPCLTVLAWSEAPEDVLAAVKAGNSYMAYGPQGPTIRLESGQAMIGDSVPWHPGTILKIQAGRLQSGDEIRLISQSGQLASWQADSASNLTASCAVSQPGFVRAEIYRVFIPGLPALPALLTNPVYFDEVNPNDD